MRSHYCGLVDETLIGQTVTLCGWADSRRDHGGVIFIDLRDHEGIVQAVMEPENAAAFRQAAGVRYEFCLRISGKVRSRPQSQINDRLRTGRIEVIAASVEVLNRAAPLPFMLDDNVGEDARLRYRYLDIRRPDMQRKLRMRTRLVPALRRHLDSKGFQDIETPILTKATPEGARLSRAERACIRGEFFASAAVAAALQAAAHDGRLGSLLSRSRAASATKPCALIASPNSLSSTWSSPSSANATCRISSKP